MTGSAQLLTEVNDDMEYLNRQGSVKGIVLVVDSQVPRVVREIQTIVGLFVKTFGVRIETSLRILCTRAPFGHIDACRSISNQVRQSLNITDIPFWMIENHPEDLTQLMISTEDKVKRQHRSLTSLEDIINNENKRKIQCLNNITYWLNKTLDQPSADIECNQEALGSMQGTYVSMAGLCAVQMDPLDETTLLLMLIFCAIHILHMLFSSPLVLTHEDNSLTAFLLIDFCLLIFMPNCLKPTIASCAPNTDLSGVRHCTECLKNITTINEDRLFESNPVAGGDSKDGGTFFSSPLVLTHEDNLLTALLLIDFSLFIFMPNCMKPTTSSCVSITDLAGVRHCTECLNNITTNDVRLFEFNRVAGGDSKDGGTNLPSFDPIFSSTAVGGHAINTLHVLLSSPLVLTHDSDALTALPGFDTDNEIALLKQVGIEVNRNISIHFNVATVNTFSTLLSLGEEGRWSAYLSYSMMMIMMMMIMMYN